MSKAQSQYELFQEWLNDCPVQIESYEDNVDSVYVRFDIEVEEEKVTITPEDNAPVIINLPEGTNLKKVVRTPAQSPQKNNLDLHKIVKDYPRDAFAIALLPLLLLEALTKEGLKYAGVSL